MTDFIAITRTNLKALIDAALSDSATPADADFIATAMQELDSPVASDKPSFEDIRTLFELACKSSRTYRFPLGPLVVNGAFRNYMDSDTDSAFIGYKAGFVRGLKWQRQVAQINAATENQPLPTPAPQEEPQS